MKILHTDNDENPAIEVPAETFFEQQNQAKKNPIDLGTGKEVVEQHEPSKKDNKVIWTIVIILVIMIVVGLIYYFKIKAKKENEHIGN
jgi:hypothetical protein